ncbi:MAG: transcriptional repressor LexA [Ruminococcaceae bacterium]|nr:transcriptional repressor LexA [Oscillospiraceae bacterium]
MPTAKQEEILNCIELYIREKGYPPSIRDICKEVNLSSSSTVFSHLAALEKKGFIQRDDGATRGIRLTDPRSVNSACVDSKASADDIISVPVIGKVAAGTPILATENIERTMPIPGDFAPGQEVFMLTVKGDSMIEIGILDGDYVLVQRQSTARDGDVIVALIEDEATVKTFYKERDCFRLQPENRYLKAIYTKELIVLGKVIGVFRKM